MKEKGKLWLVPTPIGNPEDMSSRALRILSEVDLIAAEDTRVAARLLARYRLPVKPLLSFFEHNSRRRSAELMERLAAGDSVALISDAGLPLISDPGAVLLEAALEAGYEVTALPGPNAALTALVASGLDCGRFSFEGFLPAQGAERKKCLRKIPAEERTQIFYEAPHRLLKTLGDFREAGLAERRLCLAREISKRYEEYWRGTVAEALEKLEGEKARGEYVLVLQGAEAAEKEAVSSAKSDRAEKSHADALALAVRLYGEGEKTKAVRDRLRQEFPIGSNEAYRLCLEAKALAEAGQ